MTDDVPGQQPLFPEAELPRASDAWSERERLACSEIPEARWRRVERKMGALVNSSTITTNDVEDGDV